LGTCSTGAGSSNPAGFILPCQPYLAERPPAGPDWQHEIEWDGFRVIVRKEGEPPVVKQRDFGRV
jgi:ATP-dependent DNA ligase